MTSRITVRGPLALSAVNTDLLTGLVGNVDGWYDAKDFNSASVTIMTTAGITGGVVSFEGTDDLTNAAAGTAIYAYDTASITAAPVSSLTLAASTTKRYTLPLTSRYVRFRISTAVTGGTVGATATFSQPGYSSVRSGYSSQLPALGTAGSAATDVITVQGIASGTPLIVGGIVASGAADSGNPVKTAVVYQASGALTLQDVGDRVDTQGDGYGNVRSLFAGQSANATDATSNTVISIANQTSNAAAYRLFATAPSVYNGSTWDRARGDTNGTVSQLHAMTASRWNYAAATSGIVNTTTAVTVIAAGGASVRNYITGIQIMSEALGTATELAIRDGAGGTVLWRTKIGTAGVPSMNVVFEVPLKGTANTLLEVVTLTSSGTGAVYFNAQGFQGA